MANKNKYSKMKIFHYMDKVNSLSPNTSEIKPPLHIRIKPTNVCAHKCWYCSYRADNLQLGKDMDLREYIEKEKMFEIIEDLDGLGVKAITFSGGGDPLYYKYIVETLEKLSKTNIKFALLTNGTPLKGRVAQLLAKYASWIRISIDGWDDESYAEYRGIKVGEHSKVIENIKNFVALNGECLLGISLIVDKKNASHVYDMIMQFKQIGVKSIKVSPCIVSDSGVENNNYHKEIFNTVKQLTKKAKKDFEDEFFEIFDAYHEIDEKFDKEYDWCPYLQVLPVIGADLNVYACHDKAYNLDNGVLGSIKDKTFKQFWMNDKNKFFKINPKTDCIHHCCANNNNRLLTDYLELDKNHIEFV